LGIAAKAFLVVAIIGIGVRGLFYQARASGGITGPKAISQAVDSVKGRATVAIGKSTGKLWAAITVRWPLEREGEATKHITVYFALVNDGDMPVAPRVKSSKLLINGKEYEGWSKVLEHVGVFSGKRVKRFDTLPPGEELLFGEVLEEAFRQPGI